jgi:thioredoxin 1
MINHARAEARLNHRILMVEFGANWCSDCQELAKELDERGTSVYMKTHVDVVQVDVGEFNRNLDIARSLGIDVNQGIPAAVFIPPIAVPPANRVGNTQILEYIHELMSLPL